LKLLRIIGLIFLSAVWITSLYGQYNFYHFAEDKGLPANTLSSLLKDRKGFIWVASQKGICRFDGKDFIYFDEEHDHFPDLSQSDEFEMYEDGHGTIWIGTRDQGLYCYEQDLKISHHFRYSPENKEGLSDDFVNFIFEDYRNNLWIGSHSHGIDLYDRNANTFKNFRPSDTQPRHVARMIDDLISYALDPSDENILWFGSLAGLFSFDTRHFTWKFFPIDLQFANDPSNFSGSEKTLRTMVFDDHGYLWAGTWGGGLLKFDPQSGRFEIYKYESLLPINGFRNNIKQLKWKSPKELWIVAPYRGLGIFNTTEHSFRFIDDPETGNSKIVNPAYLLTDDDGFIWLASHTIGLYTANLNAAQFNKVEMPYSIRKLTWDTASGKLFAATGNLYSRLLRIDPETYNFSEYSYKPILDKNENYFIEILPAGEKTWIIESFNLYFFDGTAIRTVNEFVPKAVAVHKQSQPFFISAVLHPEGDLWVGSKFHGLFRIIAEKHQFLNFYGADTVTNSPGFEEFIYHLFIDSEGRVWYGSEDFGFFDYRENRFLNYTTDKDVPGSDIKIKYLQSIIQTHDGNIWLGTEKNGIAVIRVSDRKLSFIKSFTIKNGLESNDIQEMAVDHEGNVWVLTGNGLSRIFTGNDNVENYGFQHGLSGLRGLTVIPGNKIIIGSKRGFYCFDPGSVSPFRIPAKPYIRSFSIFDEPVDFNQQIDSSGSIRLNYNQNFFSIEYGIIDYFNPVRRPISYMLEGIDNSWLTSSNRNSMSYANLAGGNYTFKLQAQGGNELRLPIFIETPFWKTWWFYVLILLAVFAGFFAFYRYRLGLIRRQESLKTSYNKMLNQLEMKALRAQMNPHFLFSSLNSIRYYILKQEFEDASDYITKFSKLLRLILHNSRQNVITLKEEIDTLRIYIEFEQMRFSKSFTYKENISSGVNLDSTLIQPMTLQPFVENAIWHGLMPKDKDRQLLLNVDKRDGFLIVIIEDNGVGRQKTASLKSSGNMSETKSYGLQITGERFAMLKNIRGKRSDFEITDLFDSDNHPSGTRVTIYYEI
jgi:ligand-binding sensor domain-containing protein